MGLGLHGGGIASARFLAECGAVLTVTDLRSEEVLAGSITMLSNYDIKYVLGRHDESDFRNADLVIKNPGVPNTSPFLTLCRAIETDVSLFLRLCRNPVLAVTGSKGKSTTVSALHHILSLTPGKAFLGGNITVSPLVFLDEAVGHPDKPVILELSSWQLHDLPATLRFAPAVSMITNIMKDHQNSYVSMQEYIADKELIYTGQNESGYAVFNYDDPYTKQFRPDRAQTLYVSDSPIPDGMNGAWQESGSGTLRRGQARTVISLENPHLPGNHNRRNLLNAALIADLAGAGTETIREGVLSFRGIPHRLEKICERNGTAIYNDSAATIPDATAAAVQSFSGDIVLITGGTDKQIDFSVVETFAHIPVHTVFLAGSATEKMLPYFRDTQAAYSGPFDNLERAVAEALKHCRKGSVLLFSPGATSFGMFLNEFDRGDKFRALFKHD
ncbi:MAG: UDP-N-acetylmuramoyl-L-alanine--D-glutamate ligase [Spirochaetales bacterium]|nr:UDP-N-acetylmuramoyl-L-alanine--D-glutamate ligase [Spirochaetales bacterium]